MTFLYEIELHTWYIKETDYRVQEWVRDERMPNWIFDEDQTWHFRQKKVTVYLQKLWAIKFYKVSQQQDLSKNLKISRKA